MINTCRVTRFRPSLRLALGAVTCVFGLTAPPISAQGSGPPAIELRGVEIGVGTSPSKIAVAKVNADLRALHEPTSGQEEAAPAFQSRNSIASIAGGSVVIDTAASGDPEALAADLRALGAKKVTVFGRMVSAILPTTAIPELNNLSSMQLARPAYRSTMVGQFTSQGDAAMRSDVTRTAFDIDGSGVMIGTLSDSYNCFGGAGQRIVSGDLPTGVLVLDELDFCDTGIDEGQAMMEIIHDVAPGSPLAFHTAFEGEASFAQGIIDLADAGAKVINDDVMYFAEPMFQDGIIAQAVDTVKARGVSYFSAAGNYARRSYEARFRPSGQLFDIGLGPKEAHDFDPGLGIDTCQQITIPFGNIMWLTFQWDQPFASVSGSPGSASDMDIVITNAACDTVFTGGFESNVGGDPVEVFGIDSQTAVDGQQRGLIILRHAGPNPGLMKIVNFGSSQATFDEYATNSSTSWGHSAALGGLGVAAANFRDTPAFAVSPPLIEDFSSAGGAPILFDTAGNRLPAAQVRQQPDITAPDGVNTVGFGVFFGTSAAAPHAAAVAALMKELVPSLTPEDTYDALKDTAIDMAAPGFDFGTGFGLIQADAATNAVAPDQEDIPPDEPEEPTGPRPEPVLPVHPSPPTSSPTEPTGPPVTPTPTLPPPRPVVPVLPRSDLCRGLPATIVGTERSDTIIGTPGPDVIHGLGGNDLIRGGAGNDLICGGAGRDSVFGGPGRDKLFGEGGRDRLNAGSGRDRCNGGSGADTGVKCERKTRIP